MSATRFSPKFRSNDLPRRLAATLLAYLLAAQVSIFAIQKPVARSGGKAAIQKKFTDLRVAHVLSRLTFGARPGDFERLKVTGVDSFLAQQLEPDGLDNSGLDSRLAKLPTLGLASPVLIEQYTPPKPLPSPTPKPAVSPLSSSQSVATTGAVEKLDNSAQGASEKNETNMKMEKPEMQAPPAEQKTGTEMKKPTEDATGKSAPAAVKPPVPKPPKNPQMVVWELQRAALLRAVYSERQLYEMMVEFWENHFSIFANKDADRFLLTSFDRDTIRPSALGRFRDLLGATAQSPAMLFYLDNWQSSVQRKYPAANGKPARTTGGINENYARELMELHTMGVDGGYTQQDVQEVARCFTGWTIRKPYEEGLFFFNPATHDNGEKVVLGQKIPAGGGISDGALVLDILARHPSTAHFIATKLARRFVSDNPPSSVIDRAASTFLKTDGSIRETLRSLITAPEFFASVNYRAKMRTPFEYTVAALRALNAETDGDRPLLDWITRMGQQVFGRLTPEGYPDTAEAWLSSGTILERLNFASALATNRIKGTRIDATKLLTGVDFHEPELVAARITKLALADQISKETREGITRVARESNNPSGRERVIPAATPAKDVNNNNGAPAFKSESPSPPGYVAELITLVVGSPEFQKR